MDLSQLNDADFSALQTGNLKGMSDAGFAHLLKTQAADLPLSVKQDNQRAEDMKTYSPTAGMSTGELAAAGLGKSISEVGTTLAQAIPGTSVNRASVDEMRRRDAPLMATTAGKVGYGGGEFGKAALVALAPGAGTLLGATGYGAALGALNPQGTDDSLGSFAANTGFGALGGFTGAATGAGLSRVLDPKVPAQARSLIDANVRLTPGQRLGGGFQRMEEGLESLPFFGDFIRTSRRQSFQDFNAAVADKALAPIKGKLPAGKIGRDAVDYTEGAIGDAYDAVLKRVKSVQADSTFASEIAGLRQMVRTGTMPPEVQAQFDKVLQNQLIGKFQGRSSITAQTFKDSESEIGRLAVKYAGDASTDKRLLGDALEEMQASLRQLLERSAGPDVAGDAKAANAAWTEFKRLQKAAIAPGSKEGVFTPEAYVSAVRQLDKSKDKSAFARGSAPGQEFGENALSVMGRTVPDSGTPFRSAVGDPVKAAFASLMGTPLPVIYNRPAQSAIQMLLSGKRPALATKAAAELEMAMPALAATGITGANVYQRSGR